MRTGIKFIAITIIGAILLIVFISNIFEVGPAQRALNTYFERLSQGNYAGAAHIYSGSYEQLIEFNPEVRSDDFATLWENACQINGFQCLPIRTMQYVEENPEGMFVFMVEFNDPHDNLFVRQPCCGENMTNAEPVSLFTYHVIKTGIGNYKVNDLPVYVP